MNQNNNQLFYITIALITALAIMLAMFFNYNLKLDKRTLTLEKKNGHEQDQINQLKEKISELETEIDQLREAYNASQQKLRKYERK